MSIGRSIPGRGSDLASASTASRCARERRRHGWIVSTCSARRQVPTVSPSTSRAPGQTRDVHSAAALTLVGHQEFAVGALQQEPGIAARQEPGRRCWARRRAEQRFIPAQDPRFPDGRAHLHQRLAKRFECSDTGRAAQCPPTSRRLRA